MNLDSLRTVAELCRRYRSYRASQHWDRKRIEAHQDARLVRIIRHAAAHVPYYRSLFREIGLDVERFRGRADLHRIPSLDKQTLRTRQKEFIADNARRFGIHWESTSGSTGTPLHLIIDRSSQANKLASVLRSYQWGGYRPGKRIFSIQSYTFSGTNALYKRFPLVNMWRFNSRELTRETGREVLRMLDDLRPEVLIGYPFAISMLSKIAAEEKIVIRPVQSIVTAGETLSLRRRALLEQNFQCRVFDFYSHHENVAVISECEQQQKHLCEDFAYNEILDEEGRPAERTGEGELVGTGLYNFAMPLIRYRTGDRVVLHDKERICRCGRPLRCVSEIVGRQNDYIETPEGKLIGNVLEHSVDHAKGLILSQCVQDAIDHIYFNLVVDESFEPASGEAIEAGVRKRLGDRIRIDLRRVDELERSKSGKTPFVLSKIGREYV